MPRSKGLYPAQVKAWRQACITGQQSSREQKLTEQAQARADKKRIKELERELTRKEKALAEAAAKKAEGLSGGRQRGGVTSLPDRQQFVSLLEEAMAAGLGKAIASAEMNISLRTLQRWMRDGTVQADAHPAASRPSPANALNQQERDTILALCNSPEYASLPPSQIVPRLAD